MYDVALWGNFTASSYNKFKSVYVKCCKIFSRYSKYAYYSVTAMLTELEIPDIDTLLVKSKSAFQRQILLCDNDIMNQFVRLHIL